MQTYLVINPISIHSGILGLSPEQATARQRKLEPLGNGRYHVMLPVQFKAGEQFQYSGRLDQQSALPIGPDGKVVSETYSETPRKTAVAALAKTPVATQNPVPTGDTLTVKTVAEVLKLTLQETYTLLADYGLKVSTWNAKVSAELAQQVMVDRDSLAKETQ